MSVSAPTPSGEWLCQQHDAPHADCSDCATVQRLAVLEIELDALKARVRKLDETAH